MCGEFLTYWNVHGGLAQQGFPISDVLDEKSETDGMTYKVQYFERAVFEAHPEVAPPSNVLLGLLGTQKFRAKYPNGAPMSVASATNDTPAVKEPPLPVQPTSKYPMRKVNGPLAITLWGVQDPAPTVSGPLAPKSGNRIVALDVSMENAGGSDAVHFNGYEWATQTTDDRQYAESGSTSLRPLLTYGNLASGQRVRGWVTFEIPEGSAIAFVIYTDFGQYPIAFVL